MSKITIQWHGHSCFSVTADDYTIVLDPFADGSVPGLPNLALHANRVLCSHEHSDHSCTDAVTVTEKENSPFHVLKIDTFHDDAQGSKRGPNRIHILEAHGIRVVHFGDLGCMLTAEQTELLKKADVLMIPIGGFYTIDAAQAKEIVSALNPRVVIPMHYRSDSFGYPVIGRLDEFTKYYHNVVTYEGDTIVVDAETKGQTAVLKLGFQYVRDEFYEPTGLYHPSYEFKMK